MKAKRIMWAFVAALSVLALGLSSCEDDDNAEGVSLNYDVLSLTVGETSQIKANQSTDGTWATSDASVATVDAGMVTAVAEGVASITATVDGETSSPCVVTVLPAAEEKPVIAAPAAGMITFAIRVPANANCMAPILAGSVEGTTWGPATYQAGVSEDMIVFEQVEGTTTWYSATFAVVTANEFKPVGVKADGTSDWAFQWLTWETIDDADYSATVEVVTENGNETKYKVVDEAETGVVIYAGIDAWKSNPCVEIVPADVTFVVTPPACALDSLANGGTISIAGSHLTGIADWTPGDEAAVLTANADGNYEITLTGLDAAVTEFKFVMNGSWDNSQMWIDSVTVGGVATACAQAVDNAKLQLTEDETAIEPIQTIVIESFQAIGDCVGDCGDLTPDPEDETPVVD